MEGRLIMDNEAENPDYVLDPNTNTWIIHPSVLIMRAKTKKDRLLIESDWTQLPDVSLTNKDAWTTYRQQLRDISKQSGYPNEITWPTRPRELW